MCSGNGTGHWITHSPITPPDSSVTAISISASSEVAEMNWMVRRAGGFPAASTR